MDTLLITGAAGHVATGIRSFLRPLYHLRLFDIAPVYDARPGEDTVVGDIAKPADVAAAMQGVDKVLHLACRHGPSIDFEDTLDVNYRGTINLIEASLRENVRHLVFASSNHGWGLYPRADTPLSDAAAPRPDGWYGISKIWAEATLAYYAHANDKIITSLRIGNCSARVNDERCSHMWISFADLASLIELALSRDDTGHRAVFATADCADPFFDNSGAKKMGFAPVDAASDHMANAGVAGQAPDTGVFGTLLGGEYAVAGLNGAKSRLKRRPT